MAYRAADTATAWADTVRALPVGAAVTGEVIGRQPFGAFLAVDGRPEALGLAGVNLKPRCLELPPLGRRVTGEVFGHSEHNRQVEVVLSAWASHEDLLPSFAERVGRVVTGRITKIVPVGLLVGLADCVAGLVPLSELPGPAAARTLREGGDIAVRVLAVDLVRRRVLLSAARVPRSASSSTGTPAQGWSPAPGGRSRTAP
ncbi:S1 RNA-binding domain-containing protein [Kitasatospora sp. NBC_00315]|uniref:S1 RNA-binding domain-containing protein n=1 Tax=Kitasatospora sp. NBC_00315 TaxID=2975963 RepID=UPI0032433920